MRQKQDSNLKKEYRRQRRIIRILFHNFGNDERFRPLIKRIVTTNWGQLNFIEEYEKMIAWCAINHIKIATVLRYNNWIKNITKWHNDKTLTDLEKYERTKTRKLLDTRDHTPDKNRN